VVQYLGAKVVLADVGMDYLMGPTELAERISRRTQAVMPVHFAGQPANIAALRSVTDAKMVEDAAHMLPYDRLQGDAAAFSFYATKTMTTGEGGMLVTNDGDLAERARRMRLHGIDSNAWSRYGPGNRWAYSITEAGYKDNLTDIAAAMGIVQLERLDDMAAARAKIAARYDEGLKGTVELPPRKDSHSWHLYIIRVDPEKRDSIIERLAEQGIGASVHVIPLHLHPLYKSMGYREGQFPVAEKLYRSSISLPIWPDMTDEQVDRVIEAVQEAV
jgi:perosamine synthetase